MISLYTDCEMSWLHPFQRYDEGPENKKWVTNYTGHAR